MLLNKKNYQTFWPYQQCKIWLNAFSFAESSCRKGLKREILIAIIVIGMEHGIPGERDVYLVGQKWMHFLHGRTKKQTCLRPS